MCFLHAVGSSSGCTRRVATGLVSGIPSNVASLLATNGLEAADIPHPPIKQMVLVSPKYGGIGQVVQSRIRLYQALFRINIVQRTFGQSKAPKSDFVVDGGIF